jgi:putative transposase
VVHRVTEGNEGETEIPDTTNGTAKTIKDIRQRIVDLALDVPELSPRELAVRFTDTEKYFV